MSKYFKCEYWYGHFPCYSVNKEPEPYLKEEELNETVLGLLRGKKDMQGVLVLFSIDDDYDVINKFDALKDRAQKLIKEFTIRPGCYKKTRKVDREYHWCPEKSVMLYVKKKRKTTKKDGKKNG